MLRRRLIVVLYCSGVVAGAVAQQPPVGTRPAQPEGQMPASAPAGEQPAAQQIPWEQMSVDELLMHAEEFLRAARSNEAMVLLTLVASKDPANLKAKVLFGETAESQGDMRRARAYYLDALKSQPGDFRANLNMGRAWVRARSWRQAKGYLENALRVAPPDGLATVQTLLALTYQGLFEHEKAVAAAKGAVAREPDNLEARHVLIAVHMMMEDRDEAIRHAKLLVDAAVRKMADARGDLETLNNLYGAHAMRLEVLRDYHRTFYEQTADGRPTDKLIPGLESDAVATLKQIIEARVVLTDLARTRAHHSILQLAEKLIEYAPNDASAAMQYALLLHSTGQYERALTLFQTVLKQEPNNDQARQMVEKLQALLGDTTSEQPPGAGGTP